ncbi:CpaD family pilus assembly protein [Methylocapsa sp. S129]|uniref:CpaD family pilus assembly protein n=1 Tax=Methylocapsa sp. S129 TaxID=1641869 RepID=UPI00131C72B2|nr:CpaD family pilus assembly protein [Methylocapsa sp. S129]
MSFNPTVSLLKASKLRAVCLAGAAAISLAGCVTDSLEATSNETDDYHDRHPIVLAQAPTTLDIFPGGQGVLDKGSIDDIRAFAARYRSMGSGRIVILSPSVGGYGTRAAVDDIRRVLASTGLRGSIGLGSYPVADPSLASPIRLSFRGLKAEVVSRCGQWPHDIASGSTLEGWKNESYWNFGCATQAMLAAQVDDPRDFARARALGPSDEEMRLRAIGAVRQGQDPGTNWKVQLTAIGQVGGN